jgi:DNA-binding SARP family transcriptional activator
VETTVENRPEPKPPGLTLRLLGPAGVERGGLAVALPRSRKVRALLAFLALEKRPVERSRLCDLLWDVPNDPRGELRWCLSKLRAALDDVQRRRVLTPERSQIGLDLSDCQVDALEVERGLKPALDELPFERLTQLGELFRGELLEGLQIDGNPEFGAWLRAQRQHYRSLQIRLLAALAARAPHGSDEMFQHLGSWLGLAPFDQAAHERMLAALVRHGRVHEAEAHIAATLRSFEQEGLDWSALRAAWHSLRRTPPAPAAAPAAAKAEISASLVGTAANEAPSASLAPGARRRASVAVMPFADGTARDASGHGRIADGLTEDIITRLAKLRVLFVIARGTVYALGERGIGAQEAGRILNVEYVASGSLRRVGDRVSVRVELAETQNARIVWTDEFEGTADQTFSVLDSIVDRIVAALADEIQSAECSRSMLRPPSSLDAWEAYHRGLWHMYRFNGPDNLEAEGFFRGALKLDPTFSRAYAGLSFTHFQNAFLSLTTDPERQIQLALEVAAQSLGADDRDPAAHWALGRALWLSRKHDESLLELQRSIELSPNFALGYYTLGFVQAQGGDPRAAIEATDYSRQLSPFDPLQFGMLASRALAHVRLGQFDEAAAWSVRAAGRPNAHAHILAIAAQCLVLAQRKDEARAFVARIRSRVPAYGGEDFLRAFRFGLDTEQLFRRAARQIDF